MGGPPPWNDRPRGEPLRLAAIERALRSRSIRSAVTGHRSAESAESAVLIPVYEHEGHVHVILTRRAAEMRHHAHEIAFPGGRRDPGDPDLWSTALREAHEETSLDPGAVRYLGQLDSRLTGGSQTLVHPFVGSVDRRPNLEPSPTEVAAIRHVSLDELLRPDVWREEVWPLADGERTITFFELIGDTIWGATGAMLRQFLALVTGRVEGGPGAAILG